MGDARRIVFLFGSGISKPAGMPLGDEITQRVLSGEGALYYNDDVYIFDPKYGPGKGRSCFFPDEYVWRIVELLKALKAALEAAPRPPGCGFPNYEELFDAAVQIHDAVQCQEPVDLPWGRLAAQLNCELRHVWPKRQGELHDRDLEWLAQQVTTYIQCLVPHVLNRCPTRLGHLDWVAKACCDQDFAGVDIFTLNHDTVLEASLAERDLGGPATNGFDARENDLCHWNPGLYEAPQMRVRLVKLHGSVNWFMFKPIEAVGFYHPLLAMPAHGRQSYTLRGRGGEEFVFQSSRPVLLNGVQTKISAYGNWLFEPLFRLFRGSLSACSDLLVCGYGFRDPGVNEILADWLGASGGRRPVVIDKNPETLAHAMSTFASKGTLKIVKKWVEEVRWPDIKRETWP
jgi:hypothetical protein